MKLIRHGELNKEKPGIVLDDKFYDVSELGEDLMSNFLKAGDLKGCGRLWRRIRGR